MKDFIVPHSALTRTRTRSAFAAFLAIALLTSPSLPQIARPPTSASPTFDITSVKPTAQSAPTLGIRQMNVGVLVLSGMTLKSLIQTSYSIKDYQLTGGPKWLDHDRYDLALKDTTLESLDLHALPSAQMDDAIKADWTKLRAVLATRFQLVAHIETREMPTSTLVVRTKDKLKSVPCADSYFLSYGLAKGSMKLTSLAASLARDLNHPVAAPAAMAGCYEIDLKWTVDPDNSELPSIDSALKSLGLHLVTRRSQAEVLVIDHAEKPLPN